MFRFFLLLIAAFWGSSTTWGFAPTSHSVVSSPRVILRPAFVLGMAEGEEPVAAEETKAIVSTDGTYYDDEVEPVQQVGISDSMRERLRREAATGLDPDQKQTNVLLYIMGAVGVLVLLGGQGILY